ncbi:hypothetical protein [Lentzea sp. NEAU-D7]|uniref:hypothetical protein n=1 Tax=Lentzea sp. NEAU-D7 TaxID=2994667 RepID=UPI00224AC330|nr:hypothetical protein [Lentzea sp. NEAU-D7]MCX2949967.1 hypothetical protein [Lentzea sp. NEAU-D7]
MTDRTDWRVAQLAPVVEAMNIASGSIARDFGHVVEIADLRQDAAILAATNPDRVLAYLADETNPGHLVRWFWSRLRDQYRPVVRRSNRVVSTDRLGAEV